MITLKDKLSHLSYPEACKLLGAKGKQLIIQGGKYDVDVFDQVTINENYFELNLGEAVVAISMNSEKHQKLDINCSVCHGFCEHKGAAISLILEEKMTLGLSAPPPERIPMESLSEEAFVQQAIDDRIERAKKEKMLLKPLDPNKLWADYIITSQESGKSYRIALRGWERGESFCSCPDFKKNTLGTCKHIIHALDKVSRKFNKKTKDTPFKPTEICIYINYGKNLELRLLLPEDIYPEVKKAFNPFKDKHITDIKGLLKAIKTVDNLGFDVTIYPDAEEFITRKRFQEKMEALVAEIRQDPKRHPLRKQLLKTELLPYQLDGIAFAAGRGRAVLADDMGLGKTIQGIGAAELLARNSGISKVLVICPASLKSQWRLEINRFSEKTCQLVLGSAKDRPAQYDSGRFFTICNYEQVLRDILSIEKVKWDLIILDEAQRIKNWEAKTSRIVKALKSPFALVLSGTPLENKIDELFSVVEFIDDRRLGPAFRFFNQHKVVDERGKVLGYKNIDALRKRLKPLLLRRTRGQVIKELPPRTTTIIRITPTEEQLDLQKGHRQIIQTILQKKYLTEMDLMRLQKALLMCRMAANSTFLVDKQRPGYSSKLEELDELINQLKAEENRKIVLFSEWTTMLNLIEPIIENHQLNFVRLDGSIPQKKRQALINQFQNDPDCTLFITTNAGATGLNLQAANTVINIDLPWNPAVLEQRIGRAHRMGQKRPVHVFLLVTENTLEEGLLATLSAKHELSLAVLDQASDIDTVDLHTGMEDLKRRLEILLGQKPDAPEDESMKAQVENEAAVIAKKKKIAKAGGQLMGAAFAFIGEMFSNDEASEKTDELAGAFKTKLIDCLETDDDGELKMTISIPDEGMLDNMAQSLAKMVGARI
ncbi:MAG: DEAD/DEAH box helicase [Desulfobacteraceae bacterium]|nr:DEAD/DEAH box helicase [Desulfobacteraceae bacterium]MBC2756593.1 DEAD/DEAH box helicase [Desulfobacteraceae bacterium]